jgi:hypothetical protein
MRAAGRLHDLSGAILEPSDSEAASRACRALYDVLRKTCAFDDQALGTRMDAGLALAPALASHCLLDGARTSAFARGVVHAIRKAQRDSGGRPVEVVYAGTGPFAPLALLAMPHLEPGTATFTLLDLHAESVESVRRLIESLGLAEHVRDVICADATRYRHPRPVDVLVSETMQRSLAEEPFVSIVRNFRPQLSATAAIVPEQVSIHLVSVDAPADPSHWPVPFDGREHLGEVFSVEREGETPADLTLSVPYVPAAATKWLALETAVIAGGGATLAPHASGLTEPEILWDCSPLTSGLTLTFRYDAGSRPGLRWVRKG